MAITATDIPIVVKLLPREHGAWTPMAPHRVVVETVPPPEEIRFGPDEEPLNAPADPKPVHIRIANGEARQLMPIDEAIRSHARRTLFVGIDERIDDAELGRVAYVVAQLIGHPERFAVKRRPGFAVKVDADDIATDLPERRDNAFREAVAAELANAG